MRADRDNHELLPNGLARKPDGPAEIHFTSLIVSAHAAAAEAVAADIRRDSRAEVEDGPHPGKLIVTLETGQLSDVTDFIDRVTRLPGVMNAAMVYHHAEAADRLDDEISDSESSDAPPVILPESKMTNPG
ncbi:MAG: chaperone NapD [Rhodospirillales bacterium]